MTTVFGFKNPEVNVGVLVADRQSTAVDETGTPTGKYLGRKLWKSEDGAFCFGHVGNRNEQTEDFVQKLYEGKIDIQKIIEKGCFPDLKKLNIQRLGQKLPDIQKMSGIVLLTRFDKNPKLYTCFPLGKVEERGWVGVGSGERKILEYMQALQVMFEARDYLGNGAKPKGEDVIRVGLEAVRRSQSQDLYSHGLDMMVCTPEEIVDHYADLGDDFGKKLRKIQNYHNKK